MLKSCGWVVVGGGGGLQDFSVSPRPLGFGFRGFGVWGLGLTIIWSLTWSKIMIMIFNLFNFNQSSTSFIENVY